MFFSPAKAAVKPSTLDPRRFKIGFTLIEMLVVLMLMGLLLGLVSVSLQIDDRGRLGVEAERLTQLLNLAATESRLAGKPIRWTAEPASYRFWRQQADGNWIEIHDNNSLRQRKLPDGITISALRRESSGGSHGKMWLQFIPYASPEIFTIEMVSGEHHVQISSSVLGDVHVEPETTEQDLNAIQAR